MKIVAVILYWPLLVHHLGYELWLVKVWRHYRWITRTEILMPKTFVIGRVFHARWLHIISELLVQTCGSLTQVLAGKPHIFITFDIISLRKSRVPSPTSDWGLLVALQLLSLNAYISCLRDAICIIWFVNIDDSQAPFVPLDLFRLLSLHWLNFKINFLFPLN